MPVPRPPKHRIDRTIAWLTRQREARLRRLRRMAPIVDGSLVLIARTCGNSAHCRCSRGQKHVGTYLTYSIRSKTHTLYVPVDLEPEVRRWSQTYRQMKDLLREVCELQREIIRRHVQERDRKRKR